MKKVGIQNLNQELMRAAAEGNLEAVKKLVLRGADIYFRDLKEILPCHLQQVAVI